MYLNCKTYFSFKYGTFATTELVEAAAAKGITALALTNINSTYDLWPFIKCCRDHHIKPIAGVEIRNGDELLYLLLAANNQGLAWIHRFVSEHLLAEKPFSREQTFFQAAWDGFVIYPFGAKPFHELLPNERIGIRIHDLTKLYGTDWKKYEDRFVIRHPVTVQDRDHYYAHCLLRAADKNKLLSKLEKKECCDPDEIFLSPEQLLLHFRHYPGMVTNTYRLMDACCIEMDFGKDKNMQVYGGSRVDDRILLEKLASAGLRRRYGPAHKEATARLRRELDIIDTLGFTTYFLINYDFVKYAQSMGYYHVGRGSGANSLVAYCLGITEVDPIELNLFFERFLNPERTSPPDFDIDFAWTDRDDVLDYIGKRYGRDHVALLGSFPTFKSDSIIRQLGKVYGLPDEDIVQLQKTGRATDEIGRRILKYYPLLQGFPAHPSVHPCGILISEEPIYQYLMVFMPPKGLQTAHLDMFAAEEIGLNKFDVLSQRGLGHIREALRLIRENHGKEIDIYDFEKFATDEKVKHRIREADTIGCFYIESPAMRQLLKKLRCDDYRTLVAASSIIRPGVAQSGMMREYIYRYHHREEIRYLHPLFEEHLSETFGVMVFQEDVIKIAHYYAGLSLGKADILRRAMSTTKYRANNNFNLIRDEFFEKAKALGREEAVSAEVWRQMVSFAGYSFNKAHSASFARESFMSLYLKTYYPREFMVAVINNFGGFYSTQLYFMELLKAGAVLHPPCVNRSDKLTSIRGDEVYTGFIHIKDLQEKWLQALLTEREKNGPYTSVQDFIERLSPPAAQLELLVSIGAFRFTGKSKKKLLWEAKILHRKAEHHVPARLSLFEDKPVDFVLPGLMDHAIDDLYDQVEILGFPLCNPFPLVDDEPERYVPAAKLGDHLHKKITCLAYFIARKHVITKNDDEMFFGTFIDADLQWIDTVHFPDSARDYPLHDAGFYRITGKVVEDFGVYSLEVRQMEKAGYKLRAYEGK